MQPKPVRARRGASAITLILSVVLPVLAILATLYVVQVRNPAAESAQRSHEVLLRTIGLGRTIHNALAEGYVDADGDLIADAPATGVDPATLTFSYIATEDPQRYREVFAPFVAHLSRSVGRPVEYVDFTSTKEQLRAIREGRLHIAGLNTGSVPIAVNLCGFVPVGKQPGADGSGAYQMVIVARADGPVRGLEQLRGRELALTDPGSNSGFKAPLVHLSDALGMLPGRDFAIRYSGGQEQSVRGLADGTYDAAALAGDYLARAVAAGTIDEKRLRVLYTSESFPTACVGLAHNLDAALSAKLRDAILSFDFAGTALEAEFGASAAPRFLSVHYKNDWALIRRIDSAIGSPYTLD